MKRYKHLLFDLDHTLWDHKANADDTLGELFEKYALGSLMPSGVDAFTDAFHQTNFKLWDLYHMGEIDQHYIRTQRFKIVMGILGVEDYGYSLELSQDYLSNCPRRSNLMPHALEVLDYLKPKYRMSVITNGFAEIQDIKLSSSGLTGYFEAVVTSEQAGSLKPHAEIFNYALNKVGMSSEDCVMIGDNPATDIQGAREVGIDQIYYDPDENHEDANPTFRIQNLLELKELL